MTSADAIQIYLLDDDALISREFAEAVAAVDTDPPFRVQTFVDAAALFAAQSRAAADLVVVDIHLGGSDAAGLGAIRSLRADYPASLIVAFSQDLTRARQSLNVGADDFILKRTGLAEVAIRLASTYQLWQRQRRPAAARDHKDPGFVGETLERIAQRVPQLIGSAVTAVHIHGESGTGKEVVAQLFADALPPKTPFVKVNCAALSPTLLERELFGHAKGSYTGATSDQEGFLEAADGGWIFLDEVQSLPLSAQAALLRALDSHEVVRVGTTAPRKIDIRVISAANEALPELVARDRFRNDLWQRLREVVVDLPPLRERAKEARKLMRHFCATERGGPYKLSAEAEAILLQYDWREGNVRELRNCIRAMTEMHVNRNLLPLSIPRWLHAAIGGADVGGADEAKAPVASAKGLYIPRDGADYATMSNRLLLAMVEDAVARGVNPTLGVLAAELGLPKSTLVSKLKVLASRDAQTKAQIDALVRGKLAG